MTRATQITGTCHLNQTAIGLNLGKCKTTPGNLKPLPTTLIHPASIFNWLQTTQMAAKNQFVRHSSMIDIRAAIQSHKVRNIAYVSAVIL
jgi:hypothetical protein